MRCESISPKKVCFYILPTYPLSLTSSIADWYILESRIYNGLSHHDGEGQVTFIWRAGEWLIQRRGERLVNLVVAELGRLCLSRGLVLDGLHNQGDGFRRAPADDFSARVSAEIEFGIGAVLQVVKEDTLSV